jgi:hypothetical protein
MRAIQILIARSRQELMLLAIEHGRRLGCLLLARPLCRPLWWQASQFKYSGKSAVGDEKLV